MSAVSSPELTDDSHDICDSHCAVRSSIVLERAVGIKAISDPHVIPVCAIMLARHVRTMSALSIVSALEQYQPKLIKLVFHILIPSFHAQVAFSCKRVVECIFEGLASSGWAIWSQQLCGCFGV